MQKNYTKVALYILAGLEKLEKVTFQLSERKALNAASRRLKR